MASSSHAAAATLRNDPRGGWLYGPSIDLLLGAGIGYLVSVPLLIWLSLETGVGAWPVVVATMLSLFISGPHYGATILRVYEQRADRRKYAVFAVWATLALCALFVVGLHSVIVGSLLITLYATWTPWHFAGQNYGIALMFLRRRGVTIEPRAKRLLHTSFVLSVVLAFLVIHADGYAMALGSLSAPQESMFRALSLGIPQDFLRVAMPVASLAYVATLVGAVLLLRRHASARDLGVVGALALLQALWFALPAALRVMANAPLEGLAFSVAWISAAHAMQYLWVTYYYARREDPSRRLAPYLGRALLAGSTVTIFPALVFAPAFLGHVPWDAGLAVLLFSVVNLHHFILDGAIWKLRDGRVARLLLRDAPEKTRSRGGDDSRRSWFGPVVAVLGVASLAIAGIDLWEREFVINRAGGDVATMRASSERLAWIGREGAQVHVLMARALARGGDREGAIAEYRRSLEIHPTATAWVGLGQLLGSEQRWKEAADAFASGLAVDPDHLDALAFSSIASMQLGRYDLARRSLERMLELDPGNAETQRRLQLAIAAEAGKRPTIERIGR